MRGDWKDEAMQYRDVDRAAQKKAEEAMTQTRDIDGNEVKVGDKLLCVSDYASFHRLQAGNVYVAEAAYNGEPTVIAGNAYHSIDRFRLVA